MAINIRWFAAKMLAHALCLAPMVWLVYSALNDLLGADPVAHITHETGQWALRFLLICLAMTPLRRLIGQPWPIRFRRLLGLYAFFYASAHLSTYLVLDLGGYWAQIFDDLTKRPYIIIGFAAWLLLLPLAITSTKGWIRRLGRRWGLLHKSVYLIGILAVLHFIWLVKADLREPLIYAAILAVLLAARWKPKKAIVAKATQRGA